MPLPFGPSTTKKYCRRKRLRPASVVFWSFSRNLFPFGALYEVLFIEKFMLKPMPNAVRSLINLPMYGLKETLKPFSFSVYPSVGEGKLISFLESVEKMEPKELPVKHLPF